MAATKLGCSTVWANPAFSPPQMITMVRDLGVSVVVADLDADLLADGPIPGCEQVTVEVGADQAWSFPDVAPATPTSPGIISLARSMVPPPPPILLTSGTTGAPKGALRNSTVPTPDALSLIHI